VVAGKLLYIGTRPRRLPIYLVGLVESVGVEPTIVHVAALPIAYSPMVAGMVFMTHQLVDEI
jgi:hypothetical protein